ncbi:MAG: proton-conducting transporter transmembrane domain-containing protein [Anaerolineae bacterium]
MILFWLILLPITGGFVFSLLRRWPVVVVPLAGATLLAMSSLAMSVMEAESTFFLGRLVKLEPLHGFVLAYCYLLATILILAGYRLTYGRGVYPLTLFFMAVATASVAIQDTTLASLLLEAAVIIGVLVMATSEPDATITSLRVLSVVVLLGPLLLVATWALAGRTVDPNDMTLVRLGGTSLVLAVVIGIGVMPFGLWLVPVCKNGNPLAILLLGFVLQAILLVRLNNVFVFFLWPGGQQFLFSLLVLGGLITAITAGILAIFQTSIGGILAYTLIADMGIVLIGIGLGTDALLRQAILHLAYRGIALSGASISLSVLRSCIEGDHLDQLNGAWKSSPMTVIGLLLAACSLVGLPLTAGFTTRLAIIGSLGTSRLVWAAAVIAASLGSAFAWGRFAVRAFSPETGEYHHEPIVPALLSLLMGLVLFIIGCYPRVIELLPQEWTQALMSIVLPLVR